MPDGSTGGVTSAFAPDWLALREPADAAARSHVLVEELTTHLPDGPLVVHDLGCGTGSMARWLAPQLPGRQHWVLHDHDAGLLDRALTALPPRITAQARLGDLGALPELDGASLVTASALLDVLTDTELDRVVAAVARTGAPALLALSVVGEIALDPPDPLDAAFTAAFNAHQTRGGLLGPAAVAAAEAAFARHGYRTVTAPSPWRLTAAADGDLIREWRRGWVAAACEQRPDLRAQPTAERELTAVVVGHVDLLAVPR